MPAFARWGWIKTPVKWLLQCSSMSGAAMLSTPGNWRPRAVTVQVGVQLWLITPLRTLTTHGRTSLRVDWGPPQSGVAWRSIEEGDMWWIWDQIHSTPGGKCFDILLIKVRGWCKQDNDSNEFLNWTTYCPADIICDLPYSSCLSFSETYL